LHPTDFSRGSKKAFAHALAIALIRKTKLTLLHAGGRKSQSWDSFPSVRGTLEQWGVIEPGSARSAVFDQLSVRVKKVVVRERNPVAACHSYMVDHPTDLIVLATRGRGGLTRWLKGSVAAEVARGSDALSLFVPKEGRGFVSPASGSLTLSRILVPIAHTPNPQPAVQFAARVARVVGGGVHVTLLHVGDPERVPAVTLPEGLGIEWTTEVRSGDASALIVEEADRISANLIVMTTDGRDVLIDALRGSHTERVIRRADCPVLALPVEWTEEVLSGRPIGDVVFEQEKRDAEALKSVFRGAARDLHPDLADEEDRKHQTDLMSKANEAYRKRDIAELEKLRRRSRRRTE
jgi:nucleotide-binding universal stress UspA family protein